MVLNPVTEAIIAVDGFDHAKVTDLVLGIVVILQGVVVDLTATVNASLGLVDILKYGSKTLHC